MDLRELTETFLEFEKKNKMFTVKIRNIYIWHYIRGTVYFELKKIIAKEGAILRASRKNNDTEVTWKNFLNEKIMCNQFFAHQKDILMIPHERKYRDEGIYYKCIYTHLLDTYLKNSHYILDNKSMENVYAIQKSRNVLYCNLENFKRIKGLNFSYKPVTKAEMNEMITNPIENYFNIEIGPEARNNLINRMNSCLTERKYWISYYNYILNKIRPKIILMVVAYSFDRMILCEVAKKRGIPVVELEHGTIGRNVIEYNFYKKMMIPSFPDYIFTFSKWETVSARFPLEEGRIIPVGYPELEKNCNLYQRHEATRKNILFISQGINKIAEYANIAAEELDATKYHIIFQLHPKEYFNWKTTVGRYLIHPNIEVMGNYQHTVHESLAQADWVVGNFSTVLSEAQMYNVKVVVLKFGAYANLEFLYKNGYALLVDSPKHLIEEIEKDTFKPNKEVSFFEKNSLENMQRNINKIIKVYGK